MGTIEASRNSMFLKTKILVKKSTIDTAKKGVAYQPRFLNCHASNLRWIYPSVATDPVIGHANAHRKCSIFPDYFLGISQESPGDVRMQSSRLNVNGTWFRGEYDMIRRTDSSSKSFNKYVANAARLGVWSLVTLVGGNALLTTETFGQGNASASKPAATGSANFTSADLLLTAEQGPWLIMAMAFEGDGAKNKAVQLAAELRRDFNLQAYCSPKDFDYSHSVSGAGINSEGGTLKMKYRNDNVVETCAVLIGNFDSMDGTAIDETLKKVKQLKTKFTAYGNVSLDKSEGVSAYEYRNFLQRTPDAKAPKKPAEAPLRYAFKTRNPLLPAEYYKSPQVDQFVRKMNQESPFNQNNLLNSKSKFTVRVLTLRGTDSYDSWGRSADSNSSGASSQLEIAAETAHLVAKTLRAAGYEAYQFHDRYESIVCVGGFDELGKEMPDGQFQYTQGILDIVKRFGATGLKVQSKFGTSDQARLLLDDIVDSNKVPELKLSDRKAVMANFRKLSVPFDLVPMPIMIPKIEATSIYNSYTFGK